MIERALFRRSGVGAGSSRRTIACFCVAADRSSFPVWYAWLTSLRRSPKRVNAPSLHSGVVLVVRSALLIDDLDMGEAAIVWASRNSCRCAEECMVFKAGIGM
jgi:hypothetical protein